jgi:cation diffusion facilitator CzcD-associated flavoprotein CzcO
MIIIIALLLASVNAIKVAVIGAGIGGASFVAFLREEINIDSQDIVVFEKTK